MENKEKEMFPEFTFEYEEDVLEQQAETWAEQKVKRENLNGVQETFEQKISDVGKNAIKCFKVITPYVKKIFSFIGKRLYRIRILLAVLVALAIASTSIYSYVKDLSERKDNQIKTALETSLDAMLVDYSSQELFEHVYKDEVDFLNDKGLDSVLKYQIRGALDSFSYSYELEDIDELDDETIKDFEKAYTKKYTKDVKIEDLVEAEVEIKKKEKDMTDAVEKKIDKKFYLMKVKDKWYVMNILELATNYELYQ